MEICKSLLKDRLDFYELLLKVTYNHHREYDSIVKKIDDLKMSIKFIETMDRSLLSYLPVYSISVLLQGRGRFYGHHYIDVQLEIDDCINLLKNAAS